MAKKLETIELVAHMKEDLSLEIVSARSLYHQLSKYQDKKLVISISEYQASRSGAQNRWYWGVAIPTITNFHMETQGEAYTKDEIHCYNMINVAGRTPVVKVLFGVETIVMEGKTTSQMSVKEFMEFKEKLQQHYALKECVIPDPKQDSFLQEYANENMPKIKGAIL